MNTRKPIQVTAIFLLAAMLHSCASLENAVQAPGVSLKNIEIADLGFSGQTFLLAFDITNPNPFSLPVRSIDYGVDLDGERFASGKTPASFSVPAQSDTSFTISVELDLIRTAPKLLYLVREANDRGIPYEISGSLGIDLPLVKDVPFKADGTVRVDTGALGNLRTAF